MLFPSPNPTKQAERGGRRSSSPFPSKNPNPLPLGPSSTAARVLGAGAVLPPPHHQLTQYAPRMSFDLNEAPATAEEAGVPQQAALVVSQPHRPHSVATMYPPNLFQAGEGLQLHGRLNNNAFMHASSGSGFQPFERNKDSVNTKVPILAEVLDHGAIGPESVKDLECKEAKEAALAVMAQESAIIVVPQTQQPLHHVLPTNPSNLFQPGEGSQLDDNVFDASEVERMKEDLRKKDENIAALQRNFGVIEQNYADVNRRIGVLEHLSNANESLRKKEEELSALQHNFEVMEQNCADANKRIGVLEEHLRDANESLRKKEAELATLQHNFEVMEQNCADANKRIGVLEEHLRDANESLRKKEAELATLQHNFEVIERNYDANKRICEQLSAANESLRKKEEELTALKHSFGVTDQNYAGARKRIRVLEDQLNTVNESLQKKEEELTALKHTFGDIEQNYAGTTEKIRVLNNLLHTANESLKLEVQKSESFVEKLMKVADDTVEATGDSASQLKALFVPPFKAFLKIRVCINSGNQVYKMIVRGLGNGLKKAVEEHDKATEDDPMLVAGSTHELKEKMAALYSEYLVATLCARIFSLLEDLAKDCIPM